MKEFYQVAYVYPYGETFYDTYHASRGAACDRAWHLINQLIRDRSGCNDFTLRTDRPEWEKFRDNVMDAECILTQYNVGHDQVVQFKRIVVEGASGFPS